MFYIGITKSRSFALSTCVFIMSPIQSAKCCIVYKYFTFLFLPAATAALPTHCPTTVIFTLRCMYASVESQKLDFNVTVLNLICLFLL